MKFTLATILACAAAFALAEGDHEGPEGPDSDILPGFLKKDITCPAAGGTATLAFLCPTARASHVSGSHPHSKPTQTATHTGTHSKVEFTVTVYPSGVPTVTSTQGIDCQGTAGPSCSQLVIASPSCSHASYSHASYSHMSYSSHSYASKSHASHSQPSFSHHSYPTVTGSTMTVWAQHTTTCSATATGSA